MTIHTAALAAQITPTVVKRFFTHYYAAAKRSARGEPATEATDELLFDEAFHIVKKFIEVATHDTVEAIQAFTNTHVPSPPWAKVVACTIPLSSCHQAAQLLIEYFGEDELKNVVGGEKWWQIRGISGVQAEWIAQASDWKKAKKYENEKEKAQDEDGQDQGVGSGGKAASSSPLKKSKVDLRHERPDENYLKKKKNKFMSKRKEKKEEKQREEKKKKEAEDDDEEWEEENENEDGNRDLPSGKEGKETVEEFDRLKRVMYYTHGGGYYFGSINTHRYQLIRFARKFGGRVFAPNYRKSPNYCWPAALQDCLAGYLYLTNPPPGAPHKAIPPSQIVIAGDSAGGGIALAMLSVLRDLKQEMPAGAVLISPWCDMTHSFESIMQNTETDIIPRYGFIHKPSTLWPIPAVTSNEDPDDPRSDASGDPKSSDEPSLSVPHGVDDGEKGSHFSSKTENPAVEVKNSKKEKKDGAKGKSKAVEGGDHPQYANIPSAPSRLRSEPITVPVSSAPEGSVELKNQIQLYATNSQLTHPLCSPVLHGSLGGLPPLYIICGDAEVLRDEIIYLAHRAAHPERYPLNDRLLNASKRTREDAEAYNDKPTKVHLQVFDDQCHVLSLFAFTTAAKYAYRGVASFVKHVTSAETKTVTHPFPESAEQGIGYIHQNSSGSSLSSAALASSNSRFSTTSPSVTNPNSSSINVDNGLLTAANSGDASQSTRTGLSKLQTQVQTQNGNAQYTDDVVDSPSQSRSGSGFVDSPQTATAETSGSGFPSLDKIAHRARKQSLKAEKKRKATSGVDNLYDGQVPLMRPDFSHHMIRERVNINGQIRPLEAEDQLQALRMPKDEIGKIKEGPCMRYIEGQEKMDKKFKKEAQRVEKRRAAYEAEAQRILKKAAEYGLFDPSKKETFKKGVVIPGGKKGTESDAWEDYPSYGPTDLADETPPPSAIAGRRDNIESIQLLRTSLKIKASEIGAGISAQFDDFKGGPAQSAAEKQVEGGAPGARLGLSGWNNAMSYLYRRSSSKASSSAHSIKTHGHQRRKQKGSGRVQDGPSQLQEEIVDEEPEAEESGEHDVEVESDGEGNIEEEAERKAKAQTQQT